MGRRAPRRVQAPQNARTNHGLTPAPGRAPDPSRPHRLDRTRPRTTRRGARQPPRRRPTSPSPLESHPSERSQLPSRAPTARSGIELQPPVWNVTVVRRRYRAPSTARSADPRLCTRDTATEWSTIGGNARPFATLFSRPGSYRPHRDVVSRPPRPAALLLAQSVRGPCLKQRFGCA